MVKGRALLACPGGGSQDCEELRCEALDFNKNGLSNVDSCKCAPRLCREYLQNAKESKRKTTLALLLKMYNDGNEAFCEGIRTGAGVWNFGQRQHTAMLPAHYEPERRPAPIKMAKQPAAAEI
ncbi:MAG: hypothetical protein LBU32_08020 [Clostridiales bacterium]|nr:hypothetical protein [Clostridiales bacterium]